ncbi:hypothetical protein T484DRAFT_1870073 [Baffinella frigidus]|nr:hypothetical protein T484DRAFT_1870073 [Cryptophyta sp. CCMP2293]
MDKKVVGELRVIVVGELRVIVMSATINANRFSDYFFGAAVVNIPAKKTR